MYDHNHYKQHDLHRLQCPQSPASHYAKSETGFIAYDQCLDKS